MLKIEDLFVCATSESSDSDRCFYNTVLIITNQLSPLSLSVISSHPRIPVIWHTEVTLRLIDSCIRVHSLLVSVKEPDMPI